MKIVFTGATSFTGVWFTKALCNDKHTLTLLLRRPLEDYQGVRRSRIEFLKTFAVEIIDDCAFGSEHFLHYLKKRKPFDLFCHHAAEVNDYKNPNFNFVSALDSNTREIRSFFEILTKQKCDKLLLTGSLFEQGEGFRSTRSGAISPYGLSKGLTSEVFRYFAEMYALQLGKFVIPNPFGAFEDENRFTSYLAKQWLQGKIAEIKYPDYVRDNIPVSLLAHSYAHFAGQLNKDYTKFNPSYSPMPMQCFVTKFSLEMQKFFKGPCEYSFHKQTEFPEPKILINNDPIQPEVINHWNENQFWSHLSEYYIDNL